MRFVLLLCATLQCAREAVASVPASIRTKDGQLILDLPDDDSSIGVHRGSKTDSVVSISSTDSLVAAVEAGVTLAAPTHTPTDVSIRVTNGVVVVSAAVGATRENTYSISPSQRYSKGQVGRKLLQTNM